MLLQQLARPHTHPDIGPLLHLRFDDEQVAIVVATQVNHDIWECVLLDSLLAFTWQELGQEAVTVVLTIYVIAGEPLLEVFGQLVSGTPLKVMAPVTLSSTSSGGTIVDRAGDLSIGRL
jgi:hypothetical protein